MKVDELAWVKMRRGSEPKGFKESPAVLPLGSLAIQGKPGRLQGYRVLADIPDCSFFSPRNLFCGQALEAGFICLADSPQLPGLLITWHSYPPILDWRPGFGSREKVLGGIKIYSIIAKNVAQVKT